MPKYLIDYAVIYFEGIEVNAESEDDAKKQIMDSCKGEMINVNGEEYYPEHIEIDDAEKITEEESA